MALGLPISGGSIPLSLRQPKRERSIDFEKKTAYQLHMQHSKQSLLACYGISSFVIEAKRKTQKSKITFHAQGMNVTRHTAGPILSRESHKVRVSFQKGVVAATVQPSGGNLLHELPRHFRQIMPNKLYNDKPFIPFRDRQYREQIQDWYSYMESLRTATF